MIMKHLHLIIVAVLLPLLISCQVKKQAIETAREEENTTLKHQHVIDSGKLDSISASFIAEFDSLVIQLPVPGNAAGVNNVPDTATAPPRLMEARVYGGKVSTESSRVSASSAHTQRADTLHRQRQRASDEQSHTDNTAVGKPPDLLPLYIIIVIALIALLYFKFR